MAMLVKLCGENRQRAIDRDGGVFYSVRNCGCDLSTNNPSWKTASSSFKKKKRKRMLLLRDDGQGSGEKGY